MGSEKCKLKVLILRHSKPNLMTGVKLLEAAIVNFRSDQQEASPLLACVADSLNAILVRSVRSENYENRDKTRKSTKFGTNLVEGITNHFRRGATKKKYPGGVGRGFFCK